MLGRDLSRLAGGELVDVRRDIGFTFRCIILFERSRLENVKMAAQLTNGELGDMRQRSPGSWSAWGSATASITSRGSCRAASASGRDRPRARQSAKTDPRRQPTAALDKDSTINVINLLKQTTIEYGAAVMMVTHDHRIIDSAGRLVHMVDGRIMSDVVLHDALRICESCARSICSRPDAAQLTDVAEHVKKRHSAVRRDDRREGEPGEEFFVISDGEVDVVRADHEVRGWGRAIFSARCADQRRTAQRHRRRRGRSRHLCARQDRFREPRSQPAAASATSSIAYISCAMIGRTASSRKRRLSRHRRQLI